MKARHFRFLLPGLHTSKKLLNGFVVHELESRRSTLSTKKRNVAAGIWEIRDVGTGEKISRFRARRRADVDRYLQMAHIGLARPLTDFEAVFITEWDGD